MLQPTQAAPATPTPPPAAKASAAHRLPRAWTSAGHRARGARAAYGHRRPVARARKLASGVSTLPGAGNLQQLSHLAHKLRWVQGDLDSMHARHYSPLVGRFLSVDPAGALPSAPQSWNRYTYVFNRPLVATDPTGRFAETFTGLALFGMQLVPSDSYDFSGLVDFLYFATGLGSAFSSDFLTLGLIRPELDNPAFQSGQDLGDALAVVVGAYEMFQGLTGEAIGTGLDLSIVGAPAGALVNVGSLVPLLHGGGTALAGFVHLRESNRSGGGRTGRKVNADRAAAARAELERLRGEFEAAIKKPNKTPEDKAQIQRLINAIRRQTDRLRASEEHARAGQGTR